MNSLEHISSTVDIARGDCLELMREIPSGSVDMVLCDPPYGIGYKTGWRIDRSHRFAREIENDRDLSVVEAAAPVMFDLLKDDSACFIFCAWNRLSEIFGILKSVGFSVKNMIVWDKCATTAGDLEGAYAHQYEMVVFATKGRPIIRGRRHSDIWRYPRVSSDKLVHQNQKPVELLEQMILSMSGKGDLILDPFMGSGSTGIACINTDRRFVGIEIENGYYAVAKKRLTETAAQTKLFACED